MGERVRCDEKQILDLVRAGVTNVELAAAVGVCDRTLCRWRAGRPGLNDAINAERARQREAALLGHGTLACSRRGCRCDKCRAAATAAKRETRRRRAALPVPATVTHGRAYTYDYYGCRCQSCRAAKRATWRDQEARRRARRAQAAAA